MTQTQTTKTELQRRFDRNFPTIERAYNLRRKKDERLPSLMMKDGFVNPIALSVIQKMYADSAQDEVTEPRESIELETLQTDKAELEKILSRKDKTIQNLLTELAKKDETIQNTESEISKKILGVQTDKNIIEELYTEKAELQNALSEKDTAISELQTELDSIQKRSKSFINKFKSETITVIGLIFSIAYQGFHSQRFFAERYISGEDDFKNMIISTCAAIAFSVAGFKLTLHSNNKIWIYGIALIDFLIYCTPKTFDFANILAGFAIAVSIVAYSHILNASNSTK